MDEKKNRKKWYLALGIIVYGILCFLIGWGSNFLFHKTDIDREAENDTPMYSFDPFSSVSFDGSQNTDEIPWGYTAGIFNMESDECILLTPNTSVNLSGESIPASWAFQYRIHPWVDANSDGAGLVIWILDEEENILYSEEIPVKPGSQWQDHSIDLNSWDTASKIKILCNNGSAGNDECDWVILRTQAGKRIPLADNYVRSATYFADEWSINFWNCEMDHLESDLAQIKADGFDSIIIVIPWREFQPTVSPISYNDYAFSKLDELMSAADDAKLKVYARLGYTWDFYRDKNETLIRETQIY